MSLRRGAARVVLQMNNSISLLSRTRSAQRNRTGQWPYKGVKRPQRGQRFGAQIRINGKLIHLGNHLKIEDAARAYNAAALKYYGAKAILNVIPPESDEPGE
jgi:hypothetical protein